MLGSSCNKPLHGVGKSGLPLNNSHLVPGDVSTQVRPMAQCVGRKLGGNLQATITIIPYPKIQMLVFREHKVRENYQDEDRDFIDPTGSVTSNGKKERRRGNINLSP